MEQITRKYYVVENAEGVRDIVMTAFGKWWWFGVAEPDEELDANLGWHIVSELFLQEPL